MINDACILQHVYANTFGSLGIPASAFNNMLRMTYLRHSAYAVNHHMDYYNIQGDTHPEMLSEAGDWAKVGLIYEALEKGYEYVFWIDADAGIVDMDVDLREAVKDCEWGACVHDPAKSKFLQQAKIDKHINVGCMYLRNTPATKAFTEMWLNTYPGVNRWAEQGSFNQMVKEYPDIVTVIDDKWNATVNVNMVKNPVVMAWHGLPLSERYRQMRDVFYFDYERYRP